MRDLFDLFRAQAHRAIQSKGIGWIGNRTGCRGLVENGAKPAKRQTFTEENALS
jgi:hypothetical protein